MVVPFELSFRELDPSIRRDLLRFDLFVDCMFAIDIFLKYCLRSCSFAGLRVRC